MIRRHGPKIWGNVHLTEKARLADLIDVDNSSPAESEPPSAFGALRQAAQQFETIIEQACRQEVRVRALGSAWALTDIAVTDGWLVNTKALNGCFDVSNRYFADDYDEEKRDLLVIAQCGISIGELNVYLEVNRHRGHRRALKTSGIGAGQTIAGAISGATHGAGIAFGSTPDFIAGIHLVTGAGTSYWIERASNPVLNDQFAEKLGAVLLRDDDTFNAALVSFGAFGFIAAVAVETDPIYHLKFPPVRNVDQAALSERLRELAGLDYSEQSAPYHYEFVFNPYDSKGLAMEASAIRVPFEPGHPAPDPVWIVRNQRGFALGDKVPRWLLRSGLAAARWKAKYQYKQYRKSAILDDTRGTPGQLFTATISYFEGNTETAIAVSIDDAPHMREISSEVIRRLKIPCISQVRIVHPTKALLGFTRLAPKTVVFEFGLAKDRRYPVFEKALTDELRAAGIPFTHHWSKNSGIDNEKLLHMYGSVRVEKWLAARSRIFDNDEALMRVFSNAHLDRAGLG